ncbi:MAG: thiamine pyrophosphate-binding protein [Gammaproteobacteria bacterium]|nr:thiamine pyrophosphate-binding protein [Gammaproteobacteria bacterium]MDH5652801.1 thiamine pyrophosphate-binding protein [Gammaproteobacteria bacterium]
MFNKFRFTLHDDKVKQPTTDVPSFYANTELISQAQSTTTMEAGDLLIAYLEQLGIEYVFGVPGGAIEPLYNALARSSRRNSVKPVIARHETGAAFMAQGYAVETGKPGVCCATTGPGATNALTGIASAYMEEIPMLFITGQTSQSKFGRGALQDSSHNGIDTLGIYRHCTRYNSFISNMDVFEAGVVNAFRYAMGEFPGPAHLTIPVDLLRSNTNLFGPSYDLERIISYPCPVDAGALEQLQERLAQARETVLFLGEGAAEAIEEIIEFANRTQSGLVTTPGAKGLVEAYHPLYKGVFGFAGHDSAREWLMRDSVDCILAVGTAFTEWETNGWDKDALLNNRLIYVDRRAQQRSRVPMSTLTVRGDVRKVFSNVTAHLADASAGSLQYRTGLSNLISANIDSQSVSLCRGQTKPNTDTRIKPQHLMRFLSQHLPVNTRIFADAGNSTAWAVHYLMVRGKAGGINGSRGWFRMSSQFASMGWAIGSSVGAAIGNQHGAVVCITGDGSFLMNGQEFTVAIAESLPVVFIILNDHGYGMVKHGQRMAQAEPIGFALPQINFARLAEAMGAAAYRVENYLDLYELDLDEICRSQTPCLIDVCIDPEAVPPIGARVRVLGGDV